MLVLSRWEGSKTTITVPPSDRERAIVVDVVDHRPGGLVRLGFTADRDIQIDRNEVIERRQRDGI